MNWFRLTVLLLLVYIAVLLSIIGLMVYGNQVLRIQHHATHKETRSVLRNIHTQVSHLHYDRFKPKHDDKPK